MTRHAPGVASSVIALALAATTTVEAQRGAGDPSMRPFTTFRQFHGETHLTADLDYSAGALRIAPGRREELYRMELAYDDGRFTPLSAYDAASGRVTLGLQTSRRGGFRMVSNGELHQTVAVSLSPAADLSLELTMSAAIAELELGGLRLSDLVLQTGASRTTVRFSMPNATRCRAAEITAGAAEVTVTGLGNSRCDELRFEGGVGSATLDFSGTWTGDMRADLKMAMGRLTLRLPRDVGVRITADQTLATLHAPGLLAQRGAFVTPGYDEAAHKLTVAISAAFGGVGVEWIGR